MLPLVLGLLVATVPGATAGEDGGSATAELAACEGLCATVLENGGAGPGFDATHFRGKRFEGVPAGRLVEVCVYAGGGSVARVAIRASEGAAPAWRGSVPITGAGWNCAPVNVPWTTSGLLVYNEAGDAKIGVDNAKPHDSRWSNDGGASWSADAARRGYRVVIEHARAPEVAPRVDALAQAVKTPLSGLDNRGGCEQACVSLGDAQCRASGCLALSLEGDARSNGGIALSVRDAIRAPAHVTRAAGGPAVCEDPDCGLLCGSAACADASITRHARGEAAAVSVFGDAQGGWLFGIAVSAFGNASGSQAPDDADVAAVSGTGEARCEAGGAVCVSGTGRASGDTHATLVGREHGLLAPELEDPFATQASTCGARALTISWCYATTVRQEVAYVDGFYVGELRAPVKIESDVSHKYSSASAFGSAHCATPNFQEFVPSVYCAAVSGLGPASCGGFFCTAASGTGDAGCTVEYACVAASATGRATCGAAGNCVAVSGTEAASGDVGVSGSGPAEGLVAVSGTNGARGLVAVSATGDAEGSLLGVPGAALLA